MNRTILILIGILCAVITAAGIMYCNPVSVARRQLYDKNPLIRRHATVELGALNAKEAIPDITRLLSDPDTAVKLLAVAILYKLEAKESIPQIIRLLSDPEFLVRITAIAILGNLNAKEAIPDIKKLLSDPNSEICQTAEKSLKLLGVPEEEIEKAKK